MATPAPDLSRLRIDRDAPPAVRRAFRTTVIIALVAVALVAAVLLLARPGRALPVDVFTGTAATGAAGGARGTVVTANGYVVARTRASVSAKVAGRLADLRVSEGSVVRTGEVIARLENADFQARVAQTEAGITGARAQLAEVTAERQQLEREAQRLRDMRAQTPEVVSLQDFEAAASRAAQAAARVNSAVARVAEAEAEHRFAQANLENTFVRAPFAGTVLRKEAEVGEVVAPSMGGAVSLAAPW